jgi:hypothetical protein
MTATFDASLVDRVRAANRRLRLLADGADTENRAERARKRARELKAALADLQKAVEGANDLEDRAPTPPQITAPPPTADPVEYFASGDGVEYVPQVEAVAREYRSTVEASWTAFLDDLGPSLLDPTLVERLKGASQEMDVACDELLTAMEGWRSLPRTLPARGDGERAEQAANAIAEAWTALAESGATTERIRFIESVGQGRVPLTAVDDDLLAWLRETGLAAGLRVISAHG